MSVLLRRILQMVMILAALSFVLFGLLSAMPGDPVDMLITSNPRIKPEDVVRLKKLRGLDKPWYVQYVRWIWGYNDPRRPATIENLDGVALQLEDDGKVSLELDVIDHLHDPDFRHGVGDYLDAVKQADAALGAELEAMPAAAKGDIDALSEALYEKSVSAHAATAKILTRRAAESLKLAAAFDASFDGTKLVREYDKPGLYTEWFIATDSDGYETVARLPVFVAPAPAPEPVPEPVPDAPEELTEGDQQLAGGTEQPEPEVPTEVELIDMARAAVAAGGEGSLLIGRIPSQVVDQPESFQVDLTEFLVGVEKEERGDVAFRLLEGPGAIDDKGVYRHVFDGPGQTAVRFAAKERGGREARGAFSVEHGPLADDEKFNRGFLFVFAGDTEALGFSNTYKRPVWEILVGSPIVCGDGNVSPGETCDDGNLAPGDGCSAICQDEALSFWQKLDARAAGWLVTSGRVFNTVQLMLPAILLSLLIAIPLGVLAAYKQYSAFDYIANFWAFVGISLPVFWFAIMVLALFSEKLQWLPAGGIQTPGVEGGFFGVLWDRVVHTLQPAFVLSIAYTGRWLRYMRASMLEVLPLDFIRTARAKGLRERVVILKHALRNALIPVVTVLALSIPALFGGAILTETVFAWPGVGRLQYDSVMNNDYYVAIVVFLISSGLLMLGNLIADVLYVIVDPRIRKG